LYLPETLSLSLYNYIIAHFLALSIGECQISQNLLKSITILTFKDENAKNKCVNVGDINIEMQKTSLKHVVLRGGGFSF
jgi:hypothetical protein